MKNAQHTPGPWSLANGNDLQIDGPNGEAVAWTETCVGIERDRANARLIAAAPDLLAACMAVLDDLEMVPGKVYQGGIEPSVETKQMLRDAIRKATGDTP